MANYLTIDTGIQEFRVKGGGTLRFNPSDPNVYNRFMGITDEIEKIEKEFAEAAKQISEEDGAAGLKLMEETDRKMKTALNSVFGEGNDFNQILGGVNLMAAGSNGKRVIINLFESLTPIFAEGAQKCAEAKLDVIKANREQRRAAAKK